LLSALAVPNTLVSGINKDHPLAVRAIDVVGQIKLADGGQSEDDWYSFTGEKGTFVTFAVMSHGLSRIANPIDSLIYVYNGAGNLLASNDDEFETQDSLLLDFLVPGNPDNADNVVYYVKVDTFASDKVPDTATGNYELFIYSFQPDANVTPALAMGD